MAYNLFKNVVDYNDHYHGMQSVVLDALEAIPRSPRTQIDTGPGTRPRTGFAASSTPAGLSSTAVKRLTPRTISMSHLAEAVAVSSAFGRRWPVSQPCAHGPYRGEEHVRR